MTRRFSSDFLFQIRNNIPISYLISEVLKIPSKRAEGIFRFVCPLCNEYRTSVHFKTNLGRCFLCSKNFNCIDLVMIEKRVSFLTAVEFLQPLLSECNLANQ